MTAPLICLTLFALWTVSLLMIGVGPYRFFQVLVHKAKPNSFTPGTPHGPDWYQRLMRAHMNCVENLPVFASLVLVGHLAGLRDGTFAVLCQVFVAARACQTVAHLSSGRSAVVNVRFAFFLVQLTVYLLLGWMLLTAPAGYAPV